MISDPGQTKKDAPEVRAEARKAAQRRFNSTDLFEGTNEIIIVHQEADYRLRVTSKGKLILTR